MICANCNEETIFNYERCLSLCPNCNTTFRVNRNELNKEENKSLLTLSKTLVRFQSGDYDGAYKESRKYIKESDHAVTPTLLDISILSMRCKTKDFTSFPMKDSTIYILDNYYDAITRMVLNCPYVISEAPEFMNLSNKLNNLKSFASEYRNKRISFIKLRYIAPLFFVIMAAVLLFASLILAISKNPIGILTLLVAAGFLFIANSLHFISMTKALIKLNNSDPTVSSPFILYKDLEQ